MHTHGGAQPDTVIFIVCAGAGMLTDYVEGVHGVLQVTGSYDNVCHIMPSCPPEHTGQIRRVNALGSIESFEHVIHKISTNV